MSPSPNPSEGAPLPDDVAALKALLLAERATAARLAGQNEHLRAILKELRDAANQAIENEDYSDAQRMLTTIAAVIPQDVGPRRRGAKPRPAAGRLAAA